MIDQNSFLKPAARLRMAACHYASGNVDRSTRALKDLLRDYPSDLEAMTTLAELYRREKHFDKAASVYDQWEKEQAEREYSWSFYFQRAIIYDRAGQWERARADFDKALKLEPDQPDVLNYLGYSLLDREIDVQLAIKHIHAAYKQLPQEAHIIDSMGWAHYRMGDTKKALDYLEEALNLVPHDPVINITLEMYTGIWGVSVKHAGSGNVRSNLNRKIRK